MRYREMSSKEIVNINEGARLGILGQTDLEIDRETGKINALIIPNYKWFGLKKEGDEVKVAWSSIEKIGEDMIMIRD
ncbi:YlmC/YmxH family sporulation protein [Aciduricibacillus chroicocephali]|uniref:YlmC/YmxH family sporulation protein n=1 Tax=Aciduricibacillus chroicocephali TaxID=3054939 RepID=A0ABY9KYF8_9BACI|nr:YlmC/YmxH family sporulation protein [Bacillaceae bacterium 44XB]